MLSDPCCENADRPRPPAQAPGGARPRFRSEWLCGVVTGAVLLTGVLAAGDEIELVNGRKYRGLVLERTASYIRFKALMGGGIAELTFPASRVKSVTIDGKMPQPETPTPTPAPPPTDPTPKPGPDPAPKPGPAPANRKRTPAQINALVTMAGTTRPDWWDAVELKIPPTMDLMGTDTGTGWRPEVKIGARWYSVINPNPGRWKSGTKLIHHILEHRIKNRASARAIAEARNTLARSYLRLLKDYARAAYFYRQGVGPRAAPGRRFNANHVTCLAECYYHLSGKPMAAALLQGYSLHRFGTPASIKLWARMGYLNRALATARASSNARNAGAIFVAAGDVCRQAGDLKKAAAFYEQAAAKLKGNWKTMAAAAAESMRLLDGLDLGKVADGEYTGAAAGYRGDNAIEVKVTVKAGRIEDVKVTRCRDDMPFTSCTDVPKSIVANQGLKGVDTVTGATASSEAVIRAAAAALAKGMRK